MRPRHLPNLLSASRILCAPLMLFFAWLGMFWGFVCCVAMAAATDILDGHIARRFQWESSYGAMLDSIADISVYYTLAASLWLLFPVQMREQWLCILVLLVAYLAPTACSLARFRRLPSLHTHSAKFSAIMGIPTMVLWLGLGWHQVLYGFTLLQLWTAVEETLLMALMPRWECNVPGIIPWLRARRRSTGCD